jgi:aspartate/methionine/tyrosine aminotransferase
MDVAKPTGERPWQEQPTFRQLLKDLEHACVNLSDVMTTSSYFRVLAAIEALRDSTGAVDAMVEEYRRRRELFIAGLNRIPGFRCQAPQGAFYAWVNIEETGLTAEEVQTILLEEGGVAGIAGAAFGPGGKNYLRFSLVSARNLLEEALERIQRVSMHWRAAVSR